MAHSFASTRSRARRLAAVFAASPLLILGACAGAGAPGAGNSTPQKGGTLLVSSIGEMPSMDPIALSAVISGVERAAQIFDTLMYRDDVTNEVTPKLAESMESKDGATWVLTLRPEVKFTDGEPLDADAVIFNLKRHMSKESLSTAKAALLNVKTMKKTGPLEVTFTLNEADATFPLALTASTPASLIGSPKALANPEKFASNPVGAGPFKLDTWTRDSELKLVANPDYFQDGKPYLDGVTYKVISDPQVTADTLSAGQIDVASLVYSDFFRTFEGNKAFKRWSSTGGTAIVPNAKRPVGDERVREAIAIGIDPATTKKVLFPGTDNWGTDLDCVPFAEGSPVCTDEGTPKLDIAKAKALIADWIADGNDPKVEITAVQGSNKQAAYLQQELAGLGLDPKIRIIEITQLTDVTAGGDYDLLLGSLLLAGDANYADRISSTGVRKWGQVNIPGMDEAAEQGLRASTTDERNEAWQQTQIINREGNHFIWFMPLHTTVVTASRVGFDKDSLAPYAGSTMIYFDGAWLNK